MTELLNASLIALRDCMGVKKDETILIITDAKCRNIAYSLWQSGKELGNETFLLEMIERTVNGEEPPTAIAELMKLVDVVLCPTSKSMTHTNARRMACSSGARVGTLPGITEDMMIRTMSADYKVIASVTEKVTKILTEGKLAHLTTSLGTDIKMPIDKIKAISSTGLIRERGSFGNLPSGESYMMPEEGKSNGIIVVDGSIAGIGKIVEDVVRIKVENGFAVEITGKREAELLNERINQLGQKARNIAELGVGTNYLAKISGEILEDEKVLGTVHIALGNNISMGGTFDIPFHIDGIIINPTLMIDGIKILENGKPLF